MSYSQAGSEIGINITPAPLCKFFDPRSLDLTKVRRLAMAFASGRDDRICSWLGQDKLATSAGQLEPHDQHNLANMGNRI